MIKVSAEKYKKQLQDKENLFNSYFNDVVSKDIYSSAHHSFRHRCEFGLAKFKNGFNYSMIEGRNRIEIDEYPICSESIQNLMKNLLEELTKEGVLLEQLFQIEFQSSRSHEVMVSLVYHKKLAENWVKKVEALKENLKCSVIGRSKNQKIIIGHDYVTEEYKSTNQSSN